MNAETPRDADPYVRGYASGMAAARAMGCDRCPWPWVEIVAAIAIGAALGYVLGVMF